VIEAVELPGPDFVVAVQWHPEETLEDLRIFSGLLDAARDYAIATEEG
jgi:putative glutamine amidotransferase